MAFQVVCVSNGIVSIVLRLSAQPTEPASRLDSCFLLRLLVLAKQPKAKDIDTNNTTTNNNNNNTNSILPVR